MRTRREYDRTFRKGRSAHTRHFRILVAASEHGLSRLGLVVSRKVGKAHDRNRVKRLVREYFRARRHRLTPSVDVVVVAKKGASTLGLAQVALQLDPVLQEWLRSSPQER